MSKPGGKTKRFGEMSTDTKPTFRQDLRVSQGGLPGQPLFILQDPVLKKGHVFTGHEMAMARQFDGATPVSEILARANEHYLVSSEELLRFFEKLEWEFVVKTKRNQRAFELLAEWKGLLKHGSRGQFSQVLASDYLDQPLVIDAELRHDCLHSGHCCKQYAISLSKEKRAGLVDHDWSKALRQVPEEVCTAAPKRKNEPQRYFLSRRVDQSCSFYQDDRCVIHGELGYHAKPLACKLFPIDLVHTPQGIRIFVLQECATSHRSFQTGTPLREKEQQIKQVIGSQPDLMLRSVPDSVHLFDTLKVSYEAYRMLEWRLRVALQKVESYGDFFGQTAAIAYSMQRWLAGEDLDWPTLISGLPHHAHQPDPGRGCKAVTTALGKLKHTLGILRTLNEISVLVTQNQNYIDFGFAHKAIQRLQSRLKTGFPLLDPALHPDLDAYYRRFMLNYIDGKVSMFYATLFDGLAVLRVACMLAAVTWEIWEEHPRASADSFDRIHQSLAYWMTIFRFDEVRETCYQLEDQTSLDILLHAIPAATEPQDGGAS